MSRTVKKNGKRMYVCLVEGGWGHDGRGMMRYAPRPKDRL